MTVMQTSVLDPGPAHPADAAPKNACLDVERGTAPDKASVMSFVLDGVHPHDIGTILDRQGVAIRTGHHCARPLLACLGLSATARALLGCYSTRQDIDALVAGLATIRETFS